MKTKRAVWQIILNIVLIALLIANIFPVLWMVSSSLKEADELFSTRIYLIPHRPTLAHYQTVLTCKSSFRSWPRSRWAITTRS